MGTKTLGTLVMDLVANTKKFKAGLNKATTDTKKFQKRQQSAISKLTKNWRNLSTAIGGLAIVNFAKNITKQAIDAGSAITDMATATRTGIEQLQILNFAALQAGASADQMGNLLIRVQKSAADSAKGLSTAVDAFAKLNINTETFINLRPEQMLEVVGKALVEAGDDTEAYGAALDILGTRNAPKLMEALIKLGREGFGSLSEEAKRSGILMSEDTAQGLDAIADKLEIFKTATTANVGYAVVYWAKLVGIVKDADSVIKSVNETLADFGASGPQTDLRKDITKDIQGFSKTDLNLLEKQIGEFYAKYSDILLKQSEAFEKLQARRPQLYEELAKLQGAAGLAGPLGAVVIKPFIEAKLAEIDEVEQGLIKINDRTDVIRAGIDSVYQASVDFNAGLTEFPQLPAWNLPLPDDKTYLEKLTVQAQEAARSFKEAFQKEAANTALDDIFGDIDLASSQTVFGIADLKESAALQQFTSDMAQLNGLHEDYKRSLNEEIKITKKLAQVSLLKGDMETYRDAIKNSVELKNTLNDLEEPLTKLQDKVVAFGQSLEDALVNAAKNGKFAMGDLVDYVIAEIQRMIISTQIIEPLFGKSGLITAAVGGMTGGFGSFFSGLGFADGGRPPVGKASWVGEEGAELFVPDTAGTIVPQSAMSLGGGGGISNHFTVDARGADVAAVQRLENFVKSMNGSIEQRAINAVTNKRNRNPNFLTV
jgi:hypothetical protein